MITLMWVVAHHCLTYSAWVVCNLPGRGSPGGYHPR